MSDVRSTCELVGEVVYVQFRRREGALADAGFEQLKTPLTRPKPHRRCAVIASRGTDAQRPPQADTCVRGAYSLPIGSVPTF